MISNKHSRTREECEWFHKWRSHEYSHSIVNLRLRGTVALNCLKVLNYCIRNWFNWWSNQNISNIHSEIFKLSIKCASHLCSNTSLLANKVLPKLICHVILIPQARVLCLICTRACGPRACAHISGKARVPVLYVLCTTSPMQPARPPPTAANQHHFNRQLGTNRI